MNEQNEIGGDMRDDVEESRCTDCGDYAGHLTRRADGSNLCDHCEDHRAEADEVERYEAVANNLLDMKCKIHGGTEWRGGYCDKWATDQGKGPCVHAVDDRLESNDYRTVAEAEDDSEQKYRT